MNEWAQVLQPSSEWLSGLRSGELVMNLNANRVTNAASGRFVGALGPSDGLANALAALPAHPQLVTQAALQSAGLASLEPVLSTLQLTSTIGAVASVATLGVTCVGFAVVLRRLGRIEGKLDELLGKVDQLRHAVETVRAHAETLSLARIRAAGESLDRAMAAETRAKRQELSSRARDLFQEGKAHYLELWRAAEPWGQFDVPIATALEMQGRYVACAIGEMQAEFIGGDLGTYRQTIKTAAGDVRAHFTPEPLSAFRARCDAACTRGRPTLSLFDREMGKLASDLQSASKISESTASSLEASTTYAEAVEALGVEPHELVRAQRDLKGVDLVLLRVAS